MLAKDLTLDALNTIHYTLTGAVGSRKSVSQDNNGITTAWARHGFDVSLVALPSL